MKFHPFLNPSSTHFTIVFFLFFTFCFRQTVSRDSKFDACAPLRCGHGPMIKYPFWIHNQSAPFCGYPGFEIKCANNNPVLTISHDEYIIKEIFYPNHSIHVVHSAAFFDSKCPTPLYNISLDRTPFSFPPDSIDLFFLYNCTKRPDNLFKYSVECASNSTHHSFAVFDEETREHIGNLSESCRTLVKVPINVQDDVKLFDRLMEMKYSELLRSGFVLNWTAHNCSSCESSGGRCGFENSELVCFCRNKPHHKTCSSGRNYRLKIIIGVCAGIGGIAMSCIAFFFLFHHYKRKKASPLLCRCASSDPHKPDFEKGIYLGLHIFCYDELLRATDNFNESKQLGDGGFGTVYHGTLGDGRDVAVKRLYENNCKQLEQFMNEIEILARLRHQNLVMLYGCTSRNSRELLIVYEYVPNGTVADHLHGDRAKPGALPWATRLKIAIETASALAYLHASDIIHRDVKTTNILLDSSFSVKVADFGLSRLFPTNVSHISTAPQGTPGYVDPEYHQCYQLTDKSDVYSFGVVLSELISSKPAVDICRHRQEINLSTMAINKILNNELHELVDPSLGYDSDQMVKTMINSVAELAFQCLQSGKEFRPSMAEVLDILKGIQNADGKVQKEEKEDVPPDHVTRVNNNSLPYSPDSVIVKWTSTSSASNGSGSAVKL